MEIALDKTTDQGLGFKIITRGTRWILSGVAVGVLLPSLMGIVSQHQPSMPIMAFLPGAMMIVIGLQCWLIGGIHYAREVWRS